MRGQIHVFVVSIVETGSFCVEAAPVDVHGSIEALLN